VHSKGTPGYFAPGSVFIERLCLQYYNFMGQSQVKATLEEQCAGQFPDAPPPPPPPAQLYPKSEAIPHWAEGSSANCCLSVLITAGCPLGIQPPLSAGQCCQGRQLRGTLASQASVGWEEHKGRTYPTAQGAKCVWGGGGWRLGGSGGRKP
jgi:hypothetical protein